MSRFVKNYHHLIQLLLLLLLLLENLPDQYRLQRLKGPQSGNKGGGGGGSSRTGMRFLHSCDGVAALNYSSASPTVEMSQEFAATERQTARLPMAYGCPIMLQCQPSLSPAVVIPR